MSHPDNDPLVLGATFQPGGQDDYYMPSPGVFSPIPQRHLNELPGQIQDGLQRLELDASAPTSPRPAQPAELADSARKSSDNAHPTSNLQHQPPNSNSNTAPSMNAPYDRASAPRQNSIPGQKQQQQRQAAGPSPNSIPHGIALNITSDMNDEPNFSPFPKLKPRPSTVPPSDDEHLQALEEARLRILSSSDPEKQLEWAEESLRLVDILIEQEHKLSSISNQQRPATEAQQQIHTDALNIVKFLTDQQHPRATFLKGTWLEFGKFGMTQDKVEAFRCYKRAATKGYARAEYRMGMQFESTNEPIKALQHYQQGEALEDAASCYRKGMMCLLGQLGQPQDFAKAVRLIRKAADGADENAPQGAYVFGMLQAKELPQIKIPEIFLPFDLDRARHYVERAAFLGFPKAQLKMGSAYELCLLGCEFNPSLSLHYNHLAAARGDAEAEMAISKWFLCGYEGMFQKSEELAFNYALRAAESGLAMAEFALGYFHEIGVYVPVKINKALEWYQKAAANGNKDAQDRIAEISASNTLSKNDHEKVAVSRIKSQYGSRRGGRPARLQSDYQQPSLDNIRDDEDLPAPRNFYDDRNSQNYGGPPDTGPPLSQHRAPSVAPYPVDDRPVSTAPYPVDDRPVSTAPYPVDDRPPVSTTPYPLDDRPLRPGQALTPVGDRFPAGSGPHRVLPPQRVSTAGPSGPPGPPMGRGSPMPASRPFNNGPDSRNDGRSYSTPPTQQGRPGFMGPPNGRPTDGPSPGSRPSSSRMNPNPPTQAPAGARMQQQGSPPRARPEMRPQPPQQQQRPGTSPKIGSSQAPGQGFSSSQGSPPYKSNGFPRTESRPSQTPVSSTQAAPQPGSGPARPPKIPAATQPTQTPAAAAAPAKSTAPKPAGKPQRGPQTFEEMGVPAAKQDHDCSVM